MGGRRRLKGGGRWELHFGRQGGLGGRSRRRRGYAGGRSRSPPDARSAGGDQLAGAAEQPPRRGSQTATCATHSRPVKWGVWDFSEFIYAGDLRLFGATDDLEPLGGTDAKCTDAIILTSPDSFCPALAIRMVGSLGTFFPANVCFAVFFPFLSPFFLTGFSLFPIPFSSSHIPVLPQVFLSLLTASS